MSLGVSGVWTAMTSIMRVIQGYVVQSDPDLEFHESCNIVQWPIKMKYVLPKIR